MLFLKKLPKLLAVFAIGSIAFLASYSLKPAKAQVVSDQVDVADVKEKPVFEDIKFNNKLVTSEVEYVTERDKVITEIKKIETNKPIDPHTFEDWNKILEKEDCTLVLSNQNGVVDFKQILSAGITAIQNGTCN